MTAAAISVVPIDGPDIDEVARFLHDHLNPRVSVAAWAALFTPPWGVHGPNRGFQLRDGGRIVGVYGAVYAQRSTDTITCNLAAFCVLEDYREHSLRLIRALLRQKGCIFTDFSPSGNVVALNERLGFRRVDGPTRVLAHLPRLPRRGIRITTDPDQMEATLRGQDATVYRDHRAAAAARHLLIRQGDDYAYLVYRADARKRLRIFASPLYVGGDPALWARAWPQVSSWLLLRGALLFTLAEERMLPFAVGRGWTLSAARPKMLKAAPPTSVPDYLYSELTLVSW